MKYDTSHHQIESVREQDQNNCILILRRRALSNQYLGVFGDEINKSSNQKGIEGECMAKVARGVTPYNDSSVWQRVFTRGV